MAVAAALFSIPLLTSASDATDEAVKRLQQDVDRLKAQLNATAEAVEHNAGGNETSLGGYGELHYNQVDNGDNQLDFHRFVLYVGHEFNQRVRFHSELELEHAFSATGKPGEVELEQAYIEYDLNDRTVVRGGAMPVPVGILNETHEPATFYGVERNPVEKHIIPATWWEGGVAAATPPSHQVARIMCFSTGFRSTP